VKGQALGGTIIERPLDPYLRKTPAMKTQGQSARFLSALLVWPALLIVLGCSDDGLGKRYSVSGNVTYKGAPVQTGTISFVPEDKEGRGAHGQIENGSYSLTTQTPGDGAFPGKYTVTVDTREVDEGERKAATEQFAKEKKIEGLVEVPQEVQAKLSQRAKLLTPVKYLSAQSSDLKTTVEEHANTLNFELKD
jgi:hypothetical protein